LQQFFVVSYILLAPFVGAFSDALPKGRVMFISNLVKLAGCIAMLLGANPLYSYALVGLGAAAYSPAKYGILTEYLPPSKLVLANSWMEGLTVMAIILGALLGGILLNPQFAPYLQLKLVLIKAGLPGLSPPIFSILVILLLYVAAALVNLRIPSTGVDHKPLHNNPWYLVRDFWDAFVKLWKDPLGQVSLAVTTLFWGAGSTLRLITLVWASLQLHFDLEMATRLTAVSAVGIALGSIAAARWVKLENSLKVLPVGIAMGITVLSMLLVTDWHVAVVLLIIAGAMAGFFVVPMNALLQHRGHMLMGAGHSIAVQNFNENLSILGILGLYAMVIRADHPIAWFMQLLDVDKLLGAPLVPSQASFITSIVLLGAGISTLMAWLYRKYRYVETED
jgi:MFS family permease